MQIFSLRSFAATAFIGRADQHWRLAWTLAFFGVLYSAYLTTISFTVLGAACPYCLTSLALMTAIFALVGEDGRSMIWPNDVPLEVALEMQRNQDKGTKKPRPAKPAAAGEKAADPTLARRTRRGAKAASEAEREPPPAAPPSTPGEVPVHPDAKGADSAKKSKRPLPPYLRVVK